MDNTAANIWAVIPVKEHAGAKQRLSAALPAHLRSELALTMLEDVLAAVSEVRALAGIALVTRDARAIGLAQRYGARILTADAQGGHTAAVAAAARVLAAEGVDGMLQLPGDIPLVTAAEVAAVLAAHRPAPSFTIVPSRDDLGSNTIVVSPPIAVPLTFGHDSFFPHLRAAQRCGIEPTVLRLPGIGHDIDNPEDLEAFACRASSTRTQAFVVAHGLAGCARIAKDDGRGGDR